MTCRRLPAVTPNISAEYGFSVLNLDSGFRGVNRSWCVSMQPGPDGLIEIFSIYPTVSARHEPGGWREEDDFEFYISGSYPYDPERYTRWIEQVRDPDRWRNPPEKYFEVEAEFEEADPLSEEE